ncbi:MAG: cytochrome c3 family protein [Magnetovibrio sp.]|nr:cytochrome c3 family protein [Magnetovibrio sp.]
MTVGVIGALIVLGGQILDRELQGGESVMSETGPRVPGAVFPTDQFAGKDVPQPINFSHKIHAGDLAINCLYCHTYARRSKVAGIPPTSKCMGCHTIVATADERPEIAKLTTMWENGQSPAWNKVNDVPDFVHFTHERHLQRFLFDNPDMDVKDSSEVCAMCHGDMVEVGVAIKMRPLTMGFCNDCHEENDGPSECTRCHK